MAKTHGGPGPSAGEDTGARTLISELPADAMSRRWALAVVVCGALVFGALAPFATIRLDALPVFIPVVQTSLIVNDLVTALLLFAQVRVTRRPSLVVVACAYAFSALMACVHLLSFPGVFAPAGLVGGNEQTTGYLHVFWHAGFAMFMLVYARTRGREERSGQPPAAASVLPGVAVTLLSAALLAALATAGSAWLPRMLADNTYSSAFNVGRYGQWVLTAAAIHQVWRVRRRTTLDLWLLVVLGNFFIEIGLVSIFNAGRYDVGFYAGRLFALLASSVVLAAMLFEQVRIYSQLLAAQETARSEVRLREGREVLRKALVAGGAGAWSADVDSARVWWSAELEEAAGYAPGTFPGTRRACLQHVHPDDVAALRRAYRRALVRRAEFHFECRFLAADRQWRWLSGRGRPERGADGRLQLAGSAMDATERKRAEAATRELESSLRDVADHLPVLAWMARPDGVTNWFNQGWHEYTGMSRRPEAFRGWKYLAHPESLPQVTTAFERKMRAGEPFDGVIQWRAADGSYRPFLTRLVPIRDGQGAIVRWLGTSTDITEQHAAEVALRVADRRKDAVLATLVHELRTPLAPIRHSVELLGRMQGLPGDAQRVLSIIDRQSLQLSRLVEDLLDVARIQQGKLEIRRERTSLAAALVDALDAVRSACQAAGHDIQLVLVGQDVDLMADPARLRQVFINLLNNAAKFTPAGGRIRVRAEREGPEVHVVVQDSGVGIPPAYLPHIFELFSQYTRESDARRSGLGIGLALASAICRWTRVRRRPRSPCRARPSAAAGRSARGRSSATRPRSARCGPRTAPAQAGCGCPAAPSAWRDASPPSWCSGPAAPRPAWR
jgi:PAS domain S-box-containing protein